MLLKISELSCRCVNYRKVLIEQPSVDVWRRGAAESDTGEAAIEHIEPDL